MFSACAAQIMNAVRGDCVKVLKQARFLYTRYYIGLLRALTRPIFFVSISVLAILLGV
jgi:hypothetical protein